MTDFKQLKYLPKVALIGRTNVGKSTIFNKFTETSRAIISDIPGTTRDLNYGLCEWDNKAFVLIDTAGLDVSTEKKIDQESIRFVEKAAHEADVLLLVVDAKSGLLHQDKEYAKQIKKYNKPIVLVINKADGHKDLSETAEFEKLGIEQNEKISAASGAGTGDLLDKVIKLIPMKSVQAVGKNIINVAIVGKPNVGKSSLINKIAGEERSIVSEVAHTTRDTKDFAIEVEFGDKKATLNFVDTAGIRKKRKIDDEIEKESVKQSINAIYRADIVLLVIDASKEITAQDKSITKEILDTNKSLIFVVNKWDLVEDKDEHADKKYLDFLHKSFPYLTWAPVVFLSAKTGFKVQRLINVVLEVFEKQCLEISDKSLDNLLSYLIKKQTPRKTKGTKRPYIYAMKQVRVNPQAFEIEVDQPKNIHFSYIRFIKNKLRDKYDLIGVGIKLYTILYKPEKKKDYKK